MPRLILICAFILLMVAGCHGPCAPWRHDAPPVEPNSTDNSPVVMIDGKAVRLVGPVQLDNTDTPIGPLLMTPGTSPDNVSAPPARPMRPVKVVVVDAGHGGERDFGAVADGVCEKDINLDVAQRLAEELRKTGVRVIMTRNEDVALTLDERGEIANVARADLFICVHSNAALNPDANGIEVYFPAVIFKRGSTIYDDAARAEEMNTKNLPGGALSYDGDFEGAMTAEKLALHRDLGRTLGLEIERAIVARCHPATRGVKPQTFEVLRVTSSPAVLVEIGFLTNDAERAKLTDAAYRQSIAESIAEAVKSYSKLSENGK